MSDEYTIEPSILRTHRIRDHIEVASQSKVKFGVGFLDDALIGLLPNDLMIVGGRPGFGKSQFGAHMAAFNAGSRRRVLFIALEAEPEEVEMRLKYQIVAGLFFKDPLRPKIDLSYRSWRFGVNRKELSRYETEADFIFTERFATLDTVYRKSRFTISSLRQILTDKGSEYDLVIIDHLHYFDMSGGRGQNENQELGELVKQVRDLNLFHNVPIVLLAHLRKDCYGLAPEIADFMGSSEIGKQATILLMLSKNPDKQDFKNGIYGTLFTLPKARTGTIGVAGLVNFSAQWSTYVNKYELGRVRRHGERESVEVIAQEDYPGWAKKKVTEFTTTSNQDSFEA